MAAATWRGSSRADVGDHEGPGVGGVVEGRGQPQRLGPLGQARGAGAHLGQGEGVVERRVGQGGAGHQHPVGRARSPPRAAARSGRPSGGGRRRRPPGRRGRWPRTSRRSRGRPRRPRRWPAASSARPAASCARGGPGPRSAPSIRARSHGDQLVGLLVEQVLQVPRQRQQRRLDGGQRLGGLARRSRAPGRAPGARRTPCPMLGRASARARSCSSTATRKRLDRPDRMVDLAVEAGGDAARPALARQGGGGAHRLAQRLRAASSRSPTRSHQPLLQPPPAPAAALRPADPAAQLGRLRARQRGGEGAVGGVEQVVALVEDDALERGRSRTSAFWPRAARAPSKAAWVRTRAWLAMTMSARREAADRLLDEAGAVVRAAGVDALAAPVDQVGGAGLGGRARRRTGSAARPGSRRRSCRRRGWRAPSARPGPCRSGRRCPAGPPAPPPGSSAGRGSSRGPCAPPPCGRARPGRDRARGSRARSGAAGRGCRSRPRPPARWPRPTARRAPGSPGSCRRPVPASASIMRGSPSRSRGWKAKAVSAANSAWVGRASSRPERVPAARPAAPAAGLGLDRAWSRPRPAAPGPPTPASAAQTSRPEPR